MRIRTLIFPVLVLLVSAVITLELTHVPPGSAQTPGGQGAATPAQVNGNLGQVMKGIIFPNSNVVYAAQDENPAEVKPAADPSISPNPLTSSYGGWEAVENSGLALAESANLLTIPGRRCANGRPVPLQNADWAMFVQELRDAGMAVYKAAQSKSQDAILEASDTMTNACSNCHEKYREKPLPDRCM